MCKRYVLPLQMCVKNPSRTLLTEARSPGIAHANNGFAIRCKTRANINDYSQRSETNRKFTQKNFKRKLMSCTVLSACV